MRHFWQQRLLAYDGLKGSTGTGWLPTARWARRRWAGKETGPNPTDRAKGGTRRSRLTDARGTPLSVVVAGANRTDHTLMEETLQAIPVTRPEPRDEARRHLCLDKGYDDQEPRDPAEAFGFTLHQRTRGEAVAGQREAGKTARRRVVARIIPGSTATAASCVGRPRH